MLGFIIAGWVIGGTFVLSVLCSFYLKAQNVILQKQVKTLAHEQVETEKQLGKLAAEVQKSSNIPYVINLSETVINTLADRVCNRVQTVLISQNEAALTKLN